MTPRERRIFELDPIAEAYGLTVQQVLVRSRARRLVNARRDMARHLRDKGLTLPEIGRFLGRDHTTILHLLRTKNVVLNERMESFPNERRPS